MTINSIYKETLEQIAKNEHRLDFVVVSKLKGLARELNLKENTEELAELHNTMVRFDSVMKKANALYLGNNVED